MPDATRESESFRDFAFRVAVVDAAGSLGQWSPLAAHWPADRLTRVCLHEASHAVVGLALGRFPNSVTVWRKGNGVARFGHNRDDHGQLTDAEHIAAINVVLEDAGEPVLDLEAVRAEAEAILEGHWGLIEVIAANLTSRLIDAEEATLGRRALELLWGFSMEEKGEPNAVQNE